MFGANFLKFWKMCFFLILTFLKIEEKILKLGTPVLKSCQKFKFKNIIRVYIHMIYLSQYSFQLIQLHPSYCLSSKIAPQPAHPLSDSIRALAELGPKNWYDSGTNGSKGSLLSSYEFLYPICSSISNRLGMITEKLQNDQF